MLLAVRDVRAGGAEPPRTQRSEFDRVLNRLDVERRTRSGRKRTLDASGDARRFGTGDSPDAAPAGAIADSILERIRADH